MQVSTENLLKRITLGEDLTFELIRFDEQVILQASVSDLETSLYRRFKTVLSPKDDVEFLLKMKLVTQTDESHLYPTISGILLCSNNPEQFLSSAYIQAICYRGTERNASESLSQRQSARNELISSLLARCPINYDIQGCQRSYIMDKRGEGVPIILTESQRQSSIAPVFELLDDAELKLTIFAAKSPHGDDY